jgi:hypothetical protein
MVINACPVFMGRFVSVMGGTAFANTILPTAFRKIAFNVPAVSDVFLRPIKETAQRFHGRKKMWRSNGVGMSVANDLAGA